MPGYLYIFIENYSVQFPAHRLFSNTDEWRIWEQKPLDTEIVAGWQ